MQLTTVMTSDSGKRSPMPEMGVPRDRLVCVGMIVGAHGVRGAVKVKSFTETPEDVTAYGPLSDQHGTRRFVLTPIGAVRGNILAEVEGVNDRNAAEALRGLRLYVDRDVFPPTEEDEFYHTDLIGMTAETVGGEVLGTVRAVYNHGAGDIIELALPSGAMAALPFTKAAVPVVDMAGRRLVVDPPEGVLPEKGPVGGESA
jgi:16S rRNA processing protein RimM